MDRAAPHRLLDKIVREVTRAELLAGEHGTRAVRRFGASAVAEALRDVASHANVERGRLIAMLHAHGVLLQRSTIQATLASLRTRVIDRGLDPAYALRAALLDLQHGIEAVQLLRQLARRDELFGLIRWCDDWLTARRTLVASVEAQVARLGEPAQPERPRDHVSVKHGLARAPAREYEDVITTARDPDA